MTNPAIAVDYFRFMKWFKTTYPEWYIKYQLNIIVPTEENKIMAAMDYVDPQDRPALQAIIDEYYKKVAD